MPHLTHIPDVCRLAAAFAQALPQYGWTLPFASWWHGRVLQCAHSLAPTGGAIEPLSQQHAQRDMVGLTSEAAPSCVGCCPSPASQRVLRRECVALPPGGCHAVPPRAGIRLRAGGSGSLPHDRSIVATSPPTAVRACARGARMMREDAWAVSARARCGRVQYRAGNEARGGPAAWGGVEAQSTRRRRPVYSEYT